MMVATYAEQPCPHCGHPLDSSAGFEDDVAPVAGDVAICVACHGFLLWEERDAREGGELWQVKLTPRQFAKLPGSVRGDLLRAQANLERLKAEEKAKERKAN